MSIIEENDLSIKVNDVFGNGTYDFMKSLVEGESLIERTNEGDNYIVCTTEGEKHSFFRVYQDGKNLEGFIGEGSDAYEMEIHVELSENHEFARVADSIGEHLIIFSEGKANYYDQIAVERAKNVLEADREEIFTNPIEYLGNPSLVIDVYNDKKSKFEFLTNFIPKIKESSLSLEQIELDSRVGRGTYNFVRELMGDIELKREIHDGMTNDIYLNGGDGNFVRFSKNGNIELFKPAGEVEIGYSPIEDGFVASVCVANSEDYVFDTIVFRNGITKTYDKEQLKMAETRCKEESRQFSLNMFDEFGIEPKDVNVVGEAHQDRLNVVLNYTNSLKEMYRPEQK